MKHYCNIATAINKARNSKKTFMSDLKKKQ
jgi:hypothetical protein